MKTHLTTEQMQADNTFLDSLESSLKEWKKELVLLEKELIDQALIDSRVGMRSNRYLVMEKREKDLRAYIAEANTRLGLVAERYQNHTLKNLISQSLNHIRP
jgi:hypothetical protein